MKTWKRDEFPYEICCAHMNSFKVLRYKLFKSIKISGNKLSHLHLCLWILFITLQNIPTLQHFIWFYLLSSLFFFFFGVHSTSLKYSTLWKFSLRFVHNSRTNWSFLTKCGSSYPSFNRSMFAHLYTPIHEIWNIKYSNNLFYRLAYLYIYLFIILGVGALVSQSDIRSCAPKKEKKSMFAVTRPFLRKVTENKPFFRKNLQKFIETLFLKLLYFCK